MRLEDARRYMIRFNEALGVQCRDCHDLRDFASDEKELKLAAREMMKLEIEINEQFFPEHEGGPAVTCWTCHQGSRIPATESGLGSLLPGDDDDPAAGSADDAPPAGSTDGEESPPGDSQGSEG